MAFDTRNKRIAGIPVIAGAVNGALAYVAGVIAAFLLYSILGMQPLFELATGNVPLVDGSGFAFYGGHFVPVAFADGSTTNFALDLADNGVLYVLLVLALLVGTGYYLGSAAGLETGAQRALAGASQVAGYLPLVALGATYFAYERTATGAFGGEESVALEIPLLRAVVLAGIVFPVACGAVGGALAGRAARE